MNTKSVLLKTGLLAVFITGTIFSIAFQPSLNRSISTGSSSSDNHLNVTDNFNDDIPLIDFPDTGNGLYIPTITESEGPPIGPTIGLTKTPGDTAPTPTTGWFTPSNTPTPTSIPTPTSTFTPVPTATPIVESESAYVAFYSDPQSDTDEEDVNHQRVVDYILARGANPVFNAGDLMEDGTQASMDRFNAVTATLRSTRTFYSAIGNNDRAVGDPSTPSPIYLNNFSFPNNERWYSVNWGNLHIVILDSAFAASDPSQISWFVSDIQSAASQNRITGVIFHHPTFASTIASYLLDNGVDFVLMGHNHSYNYYESGGIDYFVSSGQPNMGYFTIQVFSSYAIIRVYNSGNGFVRAVTVNAR